MGLITVLVLSFTVFFLLGGILFGLGRGLNRSLLRLGLIVVSIVLSLLLREVFVDVLMNLKSGDGTLKDRFTELFGASNGELGGLESLVLTLVRLIMGLISFMLIFGVLRFLTWLIVYPILKNFVKRGDNPHKGWGALVGGLQGLLIATVLISPLSGFVVQLNTIAQMEVDGKKVVELPDEMGVDSYVNSALGKMYNTGGGHLLFQTLTTGKDANGKTVSIESTCEVVVVFSGFSSAVESLEESVEIMASDTATPTERMEAMKDLGAELTNIGNSLNSLDASAKNVINGLFASLEDLLAEEESSDETVQALFDNLTVDNLKLATVGKSITGIGSYIEKTQEGFDNDEPVTEQEVKDIVNGFADNPFILYMINNAGGTGTLIYVEDEHSGMFQATIENADLSREEKDALLTVFGINVNNPDNE